MYSFIELFTHDVRLEQERDALLPMTFTSLFEALCVWSLKMCVRRAKAAYDAAGVSVHENNGN